MKLYSTVLCFIAILANSPAMAEEQPLETVRVTGTHLKSPDAPARIIIEKATIAAHASPDLIDSMKALPGVDVFRQGGSGSKSFLSIRGGEPNFTIILLDGIRLNNPTDSRGGGFDLALISPDMIERIEIIKGGYSAVYGSDALSGVINIITTPPGDDGLVNAHAGIGSDNGLDVGASLDGRIGERVAARISANYRDTGSWHINDQRKALDISSQANIDIGDDASIKLFGFHADADATAFPEDSGGLRLAVLRMPEIRTNITTTLGAEAAFAGTSSWRPLLTTLWSRSTERAAHPGIAPGVLQGIPPNTSDTEFQQFEIIGNNQIELGNDISVSFGATLRIEDGNSEGILDFGFPLATDFALKRTTIGAFFESRLELSPKLQTNFGVRFDKPNGRNGEYTGRASLTYIVEEKGLSAFIAWGEGFKLPSFFALGHPLVGNPDLEPEEAQNKEFTLQKSFSDSSITLSVSLFHSRFKNLIDFDPALFTSVNRSQVTTKGVELSINSKPTEEVEFDLSVTRQSSANADQNGQLRLRPKWKGRLEIFWQVGDDISFSLRAVSNGKFYDSSIPTGLMMMDGFTLLDASARWKPSKAIALDLTLANLTDASYEEAIGFPARGITARARLVTRF